MKEQIKKLLEELEEGEEREGKIFKICRLWVLWNAKELTADEFVYKIEDILPKETKYAWQKYVNNELILAKAENPLEAIMI